MAFTQAALPYAYNALEPHIDARTMEIHYSKHHATYITNLNKAMESVQHGDQKSVDSLIQSLDSLPESIRTAVRNNGGGHWNHTFFWDLMAPNAGGKPAGDLAAAIDKSLGGFEKFKTDFSQAAMTRFGSGWAWVVADRSGALSITSTPNQDTPVMEKKTPILGIDVWEHAYYLLYQNRRADYVGAWFNVINWAKVAEHYAKAKS